MEKKDYNLTIEEKSRRLENMKFENHKQFLKALVAIEFESMGIFNLEEQMQEWIPQIKSKLLEIEARNKKKKDEKPSLVIRFKTKRISSTPQINEIDTKKKEHIKKRKIAAAGCSSSVVLEGQNKKAMINTKKPAVVMINHPSSVHDYHEARLVPLSVPAVVPVQLLNAIKDVGGDEGSVMWVLEKALQNTDVSKHHDRLSIPKSQVKVKLEDYLTELSNRTAIPVDVLVSVTRDGDDDEPRLWGGFYFVTWQMGKCSVYVLRTNWWNLVQENKLQPGDKVQIWSFRRSSSKNGVEEKKLSFAIHVLRS